MILIIWISRMKWENKSQEEFPSTLFYKNLVAYFTGLGENLSRVKIKQNTFIRNRNWIDWPIILEERKYWEIRGKIPVSSGSEFRVRSDGWQQRLVSRDDAVHSGDVMRQRLEKLLIRYLAFTRSDASQKFSNERSFFI